jgi:Domain of unknown function (DUF4360)
MLRSNISLALAALPLALSLGVSSFALATNDVKIIDGSLQAKGPGCPQSSSVFADVLNDGKTVQFSFNDLFATVSASTGLMDQKNCIVTVDVDVPAGYQVAPGPVSMEATVNGISETGSATVYARYYLDGKASDLISKTISYSEFPAGGASQDLKLSSTDASGNPASWSGACGGTQKLNLQTRAIARRGASDVGITEVFVDRSNSGLNHSIACHVQLKPCQAP